MPRSSLWLCVSVAKPCRNPQSISGSRWRRAANQDFGSRLENQFFSALDENRAGADAGAENRSDRRAFTAARNAANDGAERAAGDAASRGVFSPAVGLDIAFLVDSLNGLTLLDPFDLAGESAGATVAHPDRVESQRHFGFTGSLTGFIER
jgi:hypothetical protein